MYIYNVTVHVALPVRDAWLEWMQQTHIPQMLATGKFSEARLCRVLSEEQTGGVTYAIQYRTKNRELLDRYYREDAPRLRRESEERFGEHCLAFRTELELLSEH